MSKSRDSQGQITGDAILGRSHSWMCCDRDPVDCLEVTTDKVEVKQGVERGITQNSYLWSHVSYNRSCLLLIDPAGQKLRPNH